MKFLPIYGKDDNKLCEKTVSKARDNESRRLEVVGYSRTLENEIGMTYKKFEKLNFDEQQRIIEQHRQQKRKQSNNKKVRVMIGSGENAIFIKKNRGERYMLDDGTFVRTGDTPEESRARLEDRLDDIAYSKPVAFVKKLQRRIKK